jgi:multiple antibiotic resistance protein
MNVSVHDIVTVTMVLFAVIDIIGSIPVIISLKEKSGQINPERITLVSGAIMLVFLFIGQSVLDLIGIDVQSFAVAGAFILFVISIEMLLGIKLYKEDNSKTTSVVPIAFPLIAGAGTLTTLLSIRSQYEYYTIIVGILINLVFVYIVLRNLYRIENILGSGGINILRKVFGVILLALAVKLFKSNI